MTENDIIKANEVKRTKCTVYTRVMGYHRPVETFNIGKQGEFAERTHFQECSCGNEK
jgi:anaerobic ribonucleoside-triphosphate reductase